MSLREHLLLFGKFLRHPRTVGAVAPSSAALARAMVARLDVDADTRMVELGPGTGAFTRAIVQRLPLGARYFSVEIEPAFAAEIQRKFPSVECVCASAETLPALAAARGMLPIDHILSGLPFASLPQAVTRAILDGIASSLRPGGTFTTFQYLHAYRIPAAVAFRRRMQELIGPMDPPRRIWRNVPPAFVLTWRKRPE